MRTFHHSRAAFTITELVAVLAVAAIGGVGAISAGGKLTQAERDLTGCVAMQRELVTGMLVFAADNDGWVPGTNSSGHFYLCSQSTWPEGIVDNPDAPVQNLDWITPSVRAMGHDLPADREERFFDILEDFACPAMTLRSPVYMGAGFDQGGFNAAQYAQQTGTQFRGVSYLMGPVWQYAQPSGCAGPSCRVYPCTGLIAGASFALQSVASLPPAMLPRLSDFGDLQRKVAFGDGFRYYDAGGWDFDANYSASLNGSFTDHGPGWGRSVAYGRDSRSGGLNIPVSYRHSGAMVGAYFDGHVSKIRESQSRNPSLWYPTGSTFVGGSGTAPEAFNYYQPGEILP